MHCSYINKGGLQCCAPAGKQATTIRPERKVLTTCRHGYKNIERMSLVEHAGQAPICIMHSAWHESANISSGKEMSCFCGWPGLARLCISLHCSWQ